MLRRKPLGSLARRTFKTVTAKQKKGGVFARRKAKANAINSFRRAAWQFEELMAKRKSERIEYKKTPDVNLYGLKLKPKNQAEMQEIMQALEQRKIPEKFLRLNPSLTEARELIGLLTKYYTEGMKANSREWQRLEYMLNTLSKRTGRVKRNVHRATRITNTRNRNRTRTRYVSSLDKAA